MQQVTNYLSYDARGPSAFIVEALQRWGLEAEFTQMILWYVVQIAFTYLLLKGIFRKPLTELGFNLRSFTSSLRFIFAFIILYPILYMGIGKLLIDMGANGFTAGLGTVSRLYLIKEFMCYGLLPGTGEEPFFRVFVIQLLFLAFGNGDHHEPVERKTKGVLILLSSIFFSIGHIFISWAPFSLHYDPLQLALAFGLGIIYSIMYLRTKSILAPVVCHNFSDLFYRLAIRFIL
ncbi:CPBP family intramembrane glutamic endopeptidase [Gorillibacterium massiliense]|uniref:CPBP family intramembrane glutamic endopeptidase n=1 Tax=Gorillibacterium massiliense TaxID=1280390 RepID=UPI001EE393DE|nr:CPBP family intramembrane glutamic endopeptidase [Gorillibacterium massiliense]